MAWEYVYNVKGLSTGNDHSGYCSGRDANDEDDCYFREEIEKEFVMLDLATCMKDFNERHDGCTSNGSHYCRGMYQEFVPLTVVSCKRRWNKYGYSCESDEESDEEKSDEESDESDEEECLEKILADDREDETSCTCTRCVRRNEKHVKTLNASRNRSRRNRS